MSKLKHTQSRNNGEKKSSSSNKERFLSIYARHMAEKEKRAAAMTKTSGLGATPAIVKPETKMEKLLAHSQNGKGSTK